MLFWELFLRCSHSNWGSHYRAKSVKMPDFGYGGGAPQGTSGSTNLYIVFEQSTKYIQLPNWSWSAYAGNLMMHKYHKSAICVLLNV